MTRVPILMYHSVCGERRGQLARWTLSPRVFDLHLRHLRDRGYVAYSTSGLFAALDRDRALPHRPVVLTFDDAYGDFGEYARPILERHGCTATVYVPTAYIGAATTWVRGERADARRVLDAAELRELADAGFELGAHSHTHPQLDLVPGADVRREARESKAVLEDVLQHEVRSFAYPFGFFDARAHGAVRDAGYASACAVGEVVASPRSDRWALPRLSIEADTGVPALDRLLARPCSAWAWRRSRARQVAFRQLRRFSRRAA